MKTTDMTTTQLHRAAQTMQQCGGHFAGHIARAYFQADGSNATRLVEAFPELFEKYGPGSYFYKFDDDQVAA